MGRLINLDKKYKHINWAPKMWQFLHKIKNETAATTGVYKSKLNEQKGREFSFYLFSKEMVSLIVSTPIFKLTMKWLWFPKADSGLIISAKIIVSVCVGSRKCWPKLEPQRSSKMDSLWSPFPGRFGSVTQP